MDKRQEEFQSFEGHGVAVRRVGVTLSGGRVGGGVESSIPTRVTRASFLCLGN